MIISLIVAVAQNGVIGKDNQLPWHIPEDLRFFKTVTMGHHIIMGRKNYQSIGRALPGRTSLVLSRQLDYMAPGCTVLPSLEAALQYAHESGEVEAFVIGGAEIYRQALSQAQRIYLTQVHSEFSGDVYFPDWDQKSQAPTPLGPNWQIKWSEHHPASAEQAVGYSFLRLEKA